MRKYKIEYLKDGKAEAYFIPAESVDHAKREALTIEPNLLIVKIGRAPRCGQHAGWGR